MPVPFRKTILIQGHQFYFQFLIFSSFNLNITMNFEQNNNIEELSTPYTLKWFLADHF